LRPPAIEVSHSEEEAEEEEKPLDLDRISKKSELKHGQKKRLDLREVQP
jgi:hypothetical protein